MKITCVDTDFILILFFFSSFGLFYCQARSFWTRSDVSTILFRSCSKNFRCTILTNCPNKNEFIKDLRKHLLCGWKKSIPMVCCNSDNYQKKNFKILRDSLLDLENHDSTSKKSEKNLKNFEICGTRFQQIITYIIGGKTVTNDIKWPWFASLILVKNSQHETNSFFYNYCGSTILTDEYLITSAHCFPIDNFDQTLKNNYRIGVGGNEINRMKIHEIEHIILHPNSTSKNYYNDLAIIKLKKKLIFNHSIRPICLTFLEDLNINSYLKDEFIFKNNNPANQFHLDYKKKSFYSNSLRGYNELKKCDRNKTNINSHKPRLFNSNHLKLTLRLSNFKYNDNFNNFQLFTNKKEKTFEREKNFKFNAIKYKDILSEALIQPDTWTAIAGFGDTQFGGVKSKKLKETFLKIVNRSKCNSIYSNLNSPKLKKGVNEEFICAADPRLVLKLNKDNLNLESKIKNNKLFHNFFHLNKTKLIDHNKFNNKLHDSNKLKSNEALVLSDACQGDSGGPLIVNLSDRIYNETINKISIENVKNKLENYLRSIKHLNEKISKNNYEGRFFLIGIVSLGYDCGDKEYPGVYLNLNYHKEWILNTVNFDNSQKFKF